MIPARHAPVLVTAGLFAALFILGALQYDGFGTLRVFLNLFSLGWRRDCSGYFRGFGGFAG